MKLANKSYQKLASEGPLEFLKSSKNYIQKIKRSHAEYFKQEIKHKYQYRRSAPNTYKLIHIDPAEVTHSISPRHYRRIGRYGTYILDGEWDKRIVDHDVHYDGEHPEIDQTSLVPFENYSLYRSLYNHFKEDIPWEDTEFFTRYEKLSEEGKWNSRRYAASEIQEQLAFLDDLYQNISEGKYLTQRELGKNSTGAIPPEENEVIISIGRDGDLFQDGGGQHRLMLSKIADKDEIPVRVFVRHKEWQRTRSSIAKSADPKRAIVKEGIDPDHPDLQDIVPCFAA